ncbi:hypothetical protein LIER_14396 [Lithospermum erythrorhizon]|uniref:Reverse transcriptase zinc-binding domain-containing protein n=1 Tax=Lithospermum erythrorhizon TaxID=34254 RepID=A0AAV3Q197_LITER
MMFHGKITTRDHLLKWGMCVDSHCAFCPGIESQNHLFFQSGYSGQIWRLLLQKFNAYRVYFIWEEMNARLFWESYVSLDVVYHRIVACA